MMKLLKAVSLSLALVAGATISSTALASIVVTGLDDNSGGYSLVRSEPLTASVASTLTFDWSYFSNDVDGPSYDPAGYYLDAALFQLTDDAGASAQSGTVSFAVAFGQTYGFYVQSADSSFGAASITAAAPSNDVPEPGTLALLGLGLLGLAAAKKRQHQ